MIRTFLIFYSCVAGLFLLGYFLRSPVWKRPSLLKLEYAQLFESGTASPMLEAFCLPANLDQLSKRSTYEAAQSQLSAAGMEIPTDGLRPPKIVSHEKTAVAIALEAPLSTHQQMIARIIEHGGEPSPMNRFQLNGYQEFIFFGYEEWSPLDLQVMGLRLCFEESTHYDNNREQLRIYTFTVLALQRKPDDPFSFPKRDAILSWRFPYAAWPLLLVLALLPTALLMLLRQPIARALRIAKPHPAES